MNLRALTDRLEPFPAALRAMVGDLSEEDASWRPEPGAWSILEIVNHMADEEGEDFRTRIRLTLEDPSQEWPTIDPAGDVERRRYNERDLSDSLEAFVRARAETVAWLRGLDAPEWENAHVRNGMRLRAGDVMASLAAHDPLHLRQIAKRLFELVDRDTGEFETNYAGVW